MPSNTFITNVDTNGLPKTIESAKPPVIHSDAFQLMQQKKDRRELQIKETREKTNPLMSETLMKNAIGTDEPKNLFIGHHTLRGMEVKGYERA